jgi:hypothetical protein
MRAGTEKWRPDAEKVNAPQVMIPAGRVRYVYIVGKTADGKWPGLKTSVVET